MSVPAFSAADHSGAASAPHTDFAVTLFENAYASSKEERRYTLPRLREEILKARARTKTELGFARAVTRPS